ncbi:hypothetical protein BGW39_009177 [Mortierella sp. 14UC]|nr:hypothetical protein BGW39_009177 [Mortierella sp. 14UC]
MPPSPRKGTVLKSRQTYGRQRNFAGQQRDTSPSSEEPSLPRGSPSVSSPGLKRGGSDLDAPPALKRAGSTIGSRASLILQDQAALKASHELREAGQNHQFKDEIEYILDGIRTKDRPKIRRTSCLDLVRSMLKQEFTRLFRSYNYMPVIFETIQTDRDPVTLMIAISMQDANVLRELVSIDNVLEVLIQSLDMDIDPMATMPTARQELIMASRGNFQSQSRRQAHNDLKDIVRQSGIISKGQKVLAKSIVLSIMTGIVEESVALQDVETLSLIEQHPTFLHTVIDILVEDLAWIKQPSATPGVFLPDVLDIGRIQNCLCILERLSLVSRKPATVLATNARVFPLFVQLITLCHSMNLMLHALRLLINVTNGFEPCCENLAQSGSISVLTQNIIQFYGHCRNYTPSDTELATTIDRGGQAPMDNDSERIHWTRVDSRSDSGLSFEMMTPGATPSHRGDGVRSRSTDDLEAALKAEGLLSNRPGANVGVSVKENVRVENDANGWYDILLLSIGLLINMLETNVRRRNQLTDEAIGLDCNAIGDCFVRECQCDKSTDALERLIEIYNTEATISEMNQGFDEDDSDETMTSQRTFQEQQHHYTSMEQSESLMSLTFDDGPAAVEGVKRGADQAGEGGAVAAGGGISFKAPGSLETQQSFLQIIEVLQRIELRHSESP